VAKISRSGLRIASLLADDDGAEIIRDSRTLQFLDLLFGISVRDDSKRYAAQRLEDREYVRKETRRHLCLAKIPSAPSTGHVIVLNEQHLRRLLQKFLEYYHNDRTHLSLGKDPPTTRAVCLPASPCATVASLPRVGGLHHRYEWREAA
jgi:hypothetical protein